MRDCCEHPTLNRRRHHRVAFTIVELLVVITVLALLISILLPSLNSARIQTKRISCANNLKQIGAAIHGYLLANNDHLPYVSYMPSYGSRPEQYPRHRHGSPHLGKPTDPEEPEDSEGAIYLADLLGDHMDKEQRVFECPEDTPGATQRTEPNLGKSFFETERSRYEFRPLFAGRMADRLSSIYENITHRKVSNEMLWIMRDYDNFHAPAGKAGSRRYLYVDGHVTDYEN